MFVRAAEDKESAWRKTYSLSGSLAIPQKGWHGSSFRMDMTRDIFPHTTDVPPLCGGCLCGAVRYAIRARPLGTSYCHCEDCRKAAGAPVVAWTFFPQGTITFGGTPPRTIRFASRERTFCPNCGSPLMFFDPAIPDQFEVPTCSLDAAGEFSPQDHNWTVDRLPWFETADALPRFPHETPPMEK